MESLKIKVKLLKTWIGNETKNHETKPSYNFKDFLKYWKNNLKILPKVAQPRAYIVNVYLCYVNHYQEQIITFQSKMIIE